MNAQAEASKRIDQLEAQYDQIQEISKLIGSAIIGFVCGILFWNTLFEGTTFFMDIGLTIGTIVVYGLYVHILQWVFKYKTLQIQASLSPLTEANTKESDDFDTEIKENQ
jgi:hypothetical protein